MTNRDNPRIIGFRILTDLEISELLEPLLDEENLKLVNVKVHGTKQQTLIRVFIDHAEGYITISECARFNRKLQDILDMRDVSSQNYRLEVSSPGIDWPLEYLWQFRKNCGKLVRKSNGDEQIEGVIVSVSDEGEIVLESGGSKESYTLEQLSRARIIIQFHDKRKSSRK